ncbi:MAG: hypothetical protein Q9227_003963 [Pyrenula ochraceoflavens]
MARSLPPATDTIIVGNGPSALILSYILHGNIPQYNKNHPHPDPILHAKIKTLGDLLQLDVPTLTDHFAASRISYSTQALSLNVLLDTLVRPNSETDDREESSCIQWVCHPERAVPHVVVGNTVAPGGQWVDNPVKASWDIETLSYAGMLSLPAYSFSQFHQERYGSPLPAFTRPTRRQVADYLSRYPAQVGISDAIFCGQSLSQISRTKQGFLIGSHGVTCKNLVLASGIFCKPIPPRPLLRPLQRLSDGESSENDLPLLVVGSGFSAADVIISAPTAQKIIHIFKWAPKSAPSPLRACHQQAYPEYAGVYRNMKVAAMALRSQRPAPARTNSSNILNRDWTSSYEGLPNTVIKDVKVSGRSAEVTFQPDKGPPVSRIIGSFAYVVGRRGSLDYLKPGLQAEVCSSLEDATMLSGQSLRTKALNSTEVAPHVFVVGSLTGDSLVRFAYGGCVFAAGEIIQSRESDGPITQKPTAESRNTASSHERTVMNGLDGHYESFANGDKNNDLLRKLSLNDETSP